MLFQIKVSTRYTVKNKRIRKGIKNDKLTHSLHFFRMNYFLNCSIFHLFFQKPTEKSSVLFQTKKKSTFSFINNFIHQAKTDKFKAFFEALNSIYCLSLRKLTHFQILDFSTSHFFLLALKYFLLY